MKTIAFTLAAFVAVGFTADAQAATKKKKPTASTQQQNPPVKKNEYGAGCRNQGASIMSGVCVN